MFKYNNFFLNYFKVNTFSNVSLKVNVSLVTPYPHVWDCVPFVVHSNMFMNYATLTINYNYNISYKTVLLMDHFFSLMWQPSLYFQFCFEGCLVIYKDSYSCQDLSSTCLAQIVLVFKFILTLSRELCLCKYRVVCFLYHIK